ncbi:hypothetical protein [Tenacibaculum sp. 190524A05c]|uniref:Tetratricopeptide repeat protein n=1 Tax=Tenacibaculum platacis TaxID=3137852 RepID=A0ABP1EER1_9FLAO
MNNYQDLIQKYHSNKLNNEEQMLFDNLANTNDEFKALLKEHENLNAAFQIIEDNEVSDLIKNLESKNNDKNIFLKIAAAITIFITGYYFLFYSGTNYDSYFEEYPNVYYPITRGASENDLQKAFSAYEQQNYELAIQKFDSLLIENKIPEIKFYKAMSLLNMGKKDEALALLKELSVINFDYSEETLWYLSITSILLDQKDLAKYTLQSMNEKGMKFKKKERKEILDNLN